MKFGKLNVRPIADDWDLVAKPTRKLIVGERLADIYVSKIDPKLSDTAAFCENYQVGVDGAANCVVVEARRADKLWYAACVILGSDRVDIKQ